MGKISNFEGQSQIRNLLNNEDYDKEKVDQFLKDNASIPMSSELFYDTDRYIRMQQSKIQETDAVFKSLKLPPELKKVLMCEKLPFRTKTKDMVRYNLIQDYLERVLYTTHSSCIYDNIKYYNAVPERNIQYVRGYFEYNGIDLNNKKSIGDIFCNYGNPYKDPDGIKSDFEKIDNLIEEKRNSVLGRYGELEIYNMLRENLKPEEEIKWVSKDVGELFGYDIIISNVITGEVKLIEVKTSYNNGGELTLSLNEYNKLQESIRNGIEYEMYKIEYVNGERKLFKVTHDHDEYYTVENLITGIRGNMLFGQSRIDPEKKGIYLGISDLPLVAFPNYVPRKKL